MAGEGGAGWGPLRGEFAEMRHLAAELRSLADRHGRSPAALEALLPYSRSTLAERLSGASRPSWGFVERLVEICAGAAPDARDAALAGLRTLWEAADPARGGPGTAIVPERGGGAELAASLGEAAEARRHTAGVDLALTTNTKYIAGLSAALVQLNEIVMRLTGERDALQRRIAEQAMSRAMRQARLTEQELEDTQRRLEEAVGAQSETQDLLAEAMRQRAEAQRLKDAAFERLETAMRRIADLDGMAAAAQAARPDAPAATGEVRLVVDEDLSGVDELLRRAGEALHREADNLEHLGSAALSGEAPADGSARPARRPSPVRTPKAWRGVPPRNRRFTGRESVLAELREGAGGGTVQVLTGITGVGKTQIAIEYAHRYQGEYDAVWWIPADQPALTRSSLAAMVPDLDLPPVSATGIDDAARGVLNALRLGEPFSRWLVVFDNAHDPQDLAGGLPFGPGDVLVTSQDPTWRKIVDPVAVDVFARAESVEFLRARVPRNVLGAADADLLAGTLGDLPLALEQMAALMAETGMELDQTLGLLGERPASVLAEGRPMEYPVALTAAVHLSFTNLAARMPDATVLLRTLAFFGPEPIPIDMFDARGWLSAELSSALADRILLGASIRWIVGLGLARLDPADRTLQVHPLTQAIVRENLDEQEREQRRHDAHLLLVAYASSDPDPLEGGRRAVALLPHLLASGAVDCKAPEARAYVIATVRHLRARGDFRTAADLLEGFVDEWRDRLGPNDPDYLAAGCEYAEVLRRLGRFADAHVRAEETLGGTELPGSDAFTIELLGADSARSRDLAEYVRAAERDADRLTRAHVAFGEDDPLTRQVSLELALDFCLAGDHAKAAGLYAKAVRLEADPDTADVYRLMAARFGVVRTARLLGDFATAFDAGEDARVRATGLFGPDHPLVLGLSLELSVALRGLGRGPEALKVVRDAHARSLRRWGPEQPETLALAAALVNALGVNGETFEALRLAEEAVPAHDAVFGPDHPYAHAFRSDLAVLHRAAGEPEPALDLAAHALDGLERRLGETHPATFAAAIGYTGVLAARGLADEACERGRALLDELAPRFGADHPLALACAANLAADLTALGRREEAEAVRDAAAPAYALRLGYADAVAYAAGRRVEPLIDLP